MNIAICDDERVFCEELHQVLVSCEEFPEEFHIQTFFDGAELLRYCSKRGTLDILFLDRTMPQIPGVKVAQRIRRIDRDVMIVFLTGLKDYGSEVFQIEPFDYLQKPLDEKALKVTLERARARYREQHHLINLRGKNGICALDVSEVVCVEIDCRNLVFYTKDLKYECIGKLKEYEKKLAPYGFLRCHHSFLINMKYVHSIGDATIATKTGATVPMSARKKKDCLNTFNEYIQRYQV